jgi:hypothetical protein
MKREHIICLSGLQSTKRPPFVAELFDQRESLQYVKKGGSALLVCGQLHHTVIGGNTLQLDAAPVGLWGFVQLVNQGHQQHKQHQLQPLQQTPAAPSALNVSQRA